MPYLNADPADLQRSFGLADNELPDGAVLVGTLSAAPYAHYIASLWPMARAVDERIMLVEIEGHRVWFVTAFGAAQAATFAHLAVRLGAKSMVQLGSMGGLQPGWRIGDLLVPTEVVGRDGVSRQLSRNRPLVVDGELTRRLLSSLGEEVMVRRGTLVSTTTIAFERPRDIRRWSRAGFAGVEMEAAATMAVAHHFGVPATAAFVLYDYLADDHTVFGRTVADREASARPREVMTRAAAQTVAGS